MRAPGVAIRGMNNPPLPLLIAGANGRVGRLLAAAFRQARARVALAHRGADSLDTGLPHLTWVPLDGASPLVEFCARFGAPAALVMLAGVTPGPGAKLENNTALGLAAIAAARTAGIGRVLLASSSAVYGSGRAAPWHEEDTSLRTNDYGRAKRAMEVACAAPGVTMLRIGNVAGADALLTNPRRPLLLDRFADGTGPVRSYIGPQTLARVLTDLASGPALPPVLNIAAPVPLDMADLAAAAGLPVVRQPAPTSAIARLTLDTTRLETLIRFAHSDSDAAAMVAQWRACKEPG